MLRPRKRFPRILIGLAALCGVSSARLRAQDVQPNTSHGKALMPSAKRVVFNQIVGPSATYPQWDNGYLISRELETFQDGSPNVRLYDSSGNHVVAASIWFPEAVRVLIHSATASSDGRIIASGTTEKRDGTGVGFIAMTDRTGKITNVLQTPGFGPMNTCEAPDGTVWSFGGTGYEYHSSKPKPGNTFRHFDFQKGEVASYLARSLFPFHGLESQARIRCSADEVVAYSFSEHVLIQMKYAGKAPEVYHTEEPAGLRFINLATTGPKEVYGYFWEAGTHGLYYLVFDETAKTAKWVPVPGAVGDHSAPGVIIALWGAEGDNLVVSRAEDPLTTSALHWVPVAVR